MLPFYLLYFTVAVSVPLARKRKLALNDYEPGSNDGGHDGDIDRTKLTDKQGRGKLTQYLST